MANKTKTVKAAKTAKVTKPVKAAKTVKATKSAKAVKAPVVKEAKVKPAPMSDEVRHEYLTVNKLTGTRKHTIEGIGTISVTKDSKGARKFVIKGSKKYSARARYTLGDIRKMIEGLR